MSYLRLSLTEYRVIRRECIRLNLAHRSRAAFRRGLLNTLALEAAPLADKIASLRRGQLRLLHEHFRNLERAPASADPSDLSPEEWIAFSEACVSYPLPIRFIGPFRHMLVDLFRDVSPILARKLERLSARQFEHLYDQATERNQGSAGPPSA